MKNNEELKPCPFCGSEVELYQPEDDPKFYRISCLNKECSMGDPDAWYDNKDEMTKDWNTRKGQSQHYQQALDKIHEESNSEIEKLKAIKLIMENWNNNRIQFHDYDRLKKISEVIE